jgi:uncharacterized protein involved in exopolysaccharide biosynthesis
MLPTLLAVAWKRRLAIAGFVTGVSIAAAVVALLLPTWYRAECTLLPPQDMGDAFNSMAGLIESSALSRLGLVSTASPSDVFKEILGSRTLKLALVKRFDLERRYKRKGTDRTLAELGHHLGIGVRPSGVLVVQIEDRDAATAAAMTNFLIQELDRFNRETYNTRAKRTREFLEERMADTQKRVRESVDSLTAYERLHGVVSEDQSAAAKAVGDVLSHKMTLEVRRSYVTSYARPGSPELSELDASLAAVDRELAKLPSIKQEGTRLAMEAEIQRKVFTLLTAQYEEARVQERRDTPTVTVLDAASVPEVRSRPRRMLIVLVSAVAAALLAIAWAGFEERRASLP